MKLKKNPPLEDVLLLDNYLFPGEELEEWEASRYHWWGVYHESGDLVAYGALLTIPWDIVGEGSAGYLCRSGVTPLLRGQGLQKRLIRARVRYAKSLDMEACISYTVPGNVASSNSLIACGFKLYDPQHRWAGDECLYWRKEL